MKSQNFSDARRVGFRTLAMAVLVVGVLPLVVTPVHAKTIILRSDDAEAYFDVSLFRTITDTVISKKIPQTIGVVPVQPSGAMLYDDPTLTAYLDSIKELPGVELALHGYQHSYYEFANLGLADAEAKIAAGLAVMQSVLGVTPVTFIPPYNAFNANTLQACRNEGFTRFSAAGHSDPDAADELPAGLLHVPATVDFQDWSEGGQLKSSAAIIQECQTALAIRDTIVIQIHFWAFGDSNGALNPVQYKTLVEVMGWIRAQADQGVTLKTIGQYVLPALPATGRLLRVTVSSANDDAYEADGKMHRASVFTVAGKSGATSNLAGYRFASVLLPKTAKILGARLRLGYNWATGTSCTVLYGEARDQSVAFGTAKNDLSNRARTTASVPWNGMPVLSWGKFISSPDVTAIVREIVSRPTWKTGNPVTFLQCEAATSANVWEAISFEGTGGRPYAAVLEIEYTE